MNPNALRFNPSAALCDEPGGRPDVPPNVLAFDPPEAGRSTEPFDMPDSSAPAGFVRRLAAIAFADVVGYSSRIAADDVATMQEWKRIRASIIEPSILAHRGKLLRVVGDGLFIEFNSAIDAVRWATRVQRELTTADPDSNRERLWLRIAINVDDLIEDDGELHGDGVNVAARIHQLAGPGDVVVTAAVRDYAINRIDATFEDLGEHWLKNISHPVSVLRVAAAASRHEAGFRHGSNRCGLPRRAATHGVRLRMPVVREPAATDASFDSARARAPLEQDDPFVLAVARHVCSLLLVQLGRAGS